MAISLFVETMGSARLPHLTKVIGLAALPRSGTTLLTSMMAVHKRICSVYEPWNATKKTRSVDDTIELDDFMSQVKPDLSQKDVLFIKETATEHRYIRNLEYLLNSVTPPIECKFIFLVRDPLHTFLSEAEARKTWWGETDLVPTTTVFDAWARRTIDVMHLIADTATRQDAIYLSYESLVSETKTFPRLMDLIGVQLDSDQFEYHRHLQVAQVRGDINISRSPQPMHSDSIAKREQQLLRLDELFRKSSLYGSIERLRVFSRELAKVGCATAQLAPSIGAWFTENQLAPTIPSLADRAGLASAKGRREVNAKARHTQPRSRSEITKAARPALLLHYHLFKNAGSSIDVILRRNFGSRWTRHELRKADDKSNPATLAEYLNDRPELQALSSHTALLPVPKLKHKHVIPILFVRHPIDRLKSAYEFERKQAAQTMGAKIAKEHDLAGYLRALLAIPGRSQARNFHTRRLACNEPAESGSPKELALRALDALPFVGLVEEYDRSIAVLETLVKQHFPGFKATPVHENVGPERPRLLEDRLEQIKSEVGAALYDELLAANESDLEIFTTLCKRYRGN